MLPRSIERELERAEAGLEAVIGQLVEMRLDSTEWLQALTSIAGALQVLRAACPKDARNSAVISRLRGIQARVSRVQQLLEAAAAFYCGCLVLGRTENVCYAPGGEMVSFSSGGRMQLEA
jgi:hypothetical protein